VLVIDRPRRERLFARAATLSVRSTNAFVLTAPVAWITNGA
jgi:hypothetical protein